MPRPLPCRVNSTSGERAEKPRKAALIDHERKNARPNIGRAFRCDMALLWVAAEAEKVAVVRRGVCCRRGLRRRRRLRRRDRRFIGDP